MIASGEGEACASTECDIGGGEVEMTAAVVSLEEGPRGEGVVRGESGYFLEDEWKEGSRKQRSNATEMPRKVSSEAGDDRRSN